MPTDPQDRATVTERVFPIQPQRGAPPHPLRIPWAVAERAYSVYAGRYGRAQSLEQLAERGGFGPGEMDDLLPGWRDLADACAEAVRVKLERRVRAEQELAEARRSEEAEATRNKYDPKCACMVDSPDDVCLVHSPAVARAEQRIKELTEALREAVHALGYAPHMVMSDEGSRCVADARRKGTAVLAKGATRA